LSPSLPVGRGGRPFASSRFASVSPGKILAAPFRVRIGVERFLIVENYQKATPRMPCLVRLIHAPKDVGFASAEAAGLR
jgi:hypothetical protein